MRIGALEAEAGRPEAAYAAYAAAFAEDPSSNDARAALEQLAEAMGKWDSLVEIYSNAQTNLKLEPALEREILLVIAVAYDEKLNQSEKAVEFFRMAQEIEPEDASALEALERLYTRTERWPDLVDTLKKKAELVQSLGGAREASTSASPQSWKRPSAIRTRPSRHGRKFWATIRAA